MPKIYSKQQKEHALYIIEQIGDYAAAEQLLGIPNSTLRSWWNEYINTPYSRQRFRPYKSASYDYRATDTTIPTITQLRDKMLRQVNQLIDQPTTTASQAYHNALAVRTLLDEIKRLNNAIGIPTTELPDNPDPTGQNPTP